MSRRSTRNAEHLRLAIATALTIVLFLLQAHLVGIIILYFIMSAHALIALPGRQGMFWVVLFGFLTTIFMVQIYHDLWLGLANGIGVFAGYYFVGSAALAQRRAEAAEAESQRLLDELRVAHRNSRLRPSMRKRSLPPKNAIAWRARCTIPWAIA